MAPPVSKPAGARVYSDPVSWPLVDETLDEADFLWRRRQRMLAAPEHDLRDLARLVEERLLGCIDGLRLGGDAAVARVLEPVLEEGDPARLSVVALAFAGTGAGTRGRQRLVTALAKAPEAILAPLCRGLELADPAADIVGLLEERVGSEAAVFDAAFLDLCAFQGRPPKAALEWFATSDAPSIQRAAMVVTRFLPRPQAEPIIARGLTLLPAVRAAAIESGLVLGIPACAAACAAAVEDLPDDAGALLLLAALVGSPAREHRKLIEAAAQEALAPAAVWALGFAGTRDAADTCVVLMRHGRHAPLAFEAFCSITGADATPGGLRSPEPENEEAALPPLEQDDLDADLVPNAEAALPRPDVAGVARWWDQNRTRFAPDARYLSGRPLDAGVLRQALQTASMRRRHALALALAIETRGAQQLNTRAFSRTQRAVMQSWTAPPVAAAPVPAPPVVVAAPVLDAPVPAAPAPAPVPRRPSAAEVDPRGRRPAVPRVVAPRRAASPKK